MKKAWKTIIIITTIVAALLYGVNQIPIDTASLKGLHKSTEIIIARYRLPIDPLIPESTYLSELSEKEKEEFDTLVMQRDLTYGDNDIIGLADTLEGLLRFDIQKQKRTISTISHRGSPSTAPDHTFQGYQDAIDAGSKNIELDLHISQDGNIIITHDDNLFKDTNHHGAVSRMTTSDITELTYTNGEHVHTIEDFFKKYGTKFNYILDIKYNHTGEIEQEGIKNLEKLIHDYGLERKMIFQTVYPSALKEYKEKFPNAKTMLLVNKSFNRNIDASNIKDYEYIDYFCFEQNQLSVKKVTAFKQEGKKVFSYDWNDRGDKNTLHRVLSYGVDGVYTNYTENTIEAIKLLSEKPVEDNMKG